MKFLAAAGLAGACLATSPVIAADLFDSGPPPLDAPAPEAELGSNWYIRGDVGYGQTNQATVVPAAGLFPTQYPGGFFNNGAYQQLFTTTTGQPLLFNGAPIGDAKSPVTVVRGNNKTVMGADFNMGVGYRINDWFRVEADYSFFRGPGLSAQTQIFCPGQANAVSNYAYNGASTDTGGSIAPGQAIPFGYTYDYSTCNGYLNVSQYNNLGLASGYIDLGHWGMFSPYIGAGAGINANTITGSLNYYTTSTGATYTGPTVTGSAPAIWVTDTGQLDQAGHTIYAPLVQSNGKGPQLQIGPQNWQRTINQTKYTFAAQVAAGLGVQISQSATIDLGYKLITTDITGGAKGIRQSLTLGVRYNLN
jgi:opacity protein-like surface antigen